MPFHTVDPSEDPRLRNLANRKICASLFLQQLLYFQFYASWAWILFWMIWLFHTYWQGLYFKDDDVVRIVMMSFWLLFEPIRLAAGWYGNLQENVPWLVLFCILTLAPLHAVIYYIMLASFDIQPVNKAVQMCQAIMTELELLAGIYAVRRMYKLQKQQYYLFEYAMNSKRRRAAGAKDNGTT